jgi:hypothetical protein
MGLLIEREFIMTNLNFLNALSQKLEQVLKRDNDEAELKVVLNNPVSNNGEPFADGKAVYVSLLNIEEELILREGGMTRRVNGDGILNLQPAVYLNLQLIILANVPNDYKKQLQSIYEVIEFFQSNPVFNLKNTPELAEYGFSGNDQFTVELNTLPLKDMHYIWSNLGLKQMPAVIYKLKTLKVQNSGQKSNGGVINQIDLAKKG